MRDYAAMSLLVESLRALRLTTSLFDRHPMIAGIADEGGF
jgi:hypothetical protein